MKIPIRLTCCIVAGAWMLTRPCFAENIIFPHVKSGITDVSGIVDISLPPYSADRTGKTDVTAILNKCFDDNKAYTTVYLPNGTYLVSNTVIISPACFTGGTGNCGVTRPIMQGQSRAGTVIKLAPGKLTNVGSPAPVITSGDGTAQIFNRGIHNLTVLVGANNAGANGVRWFGSNNGLMSEVNIVCEDGAANIGVDISGAEEGPCGMRDIYVKGFGIGCKSNALNSVTVWNLTVENSRQYGVLNELNPLYIDNLTCINSPVAVSNAGALTLLNARLTGGTSSKSAIENTGMLFARDVQAAGYQKALTTNGRTGPSGLAFAEYSSNQISQFPSPTHSMNLPYKAIPDVPWEQDTTKWGNVLLAKGGLGSVQKTDSAALQSLIDNPNLTTICLPSGRAYQINGDIYLRGNIRRIIGTSANVTGSGRLIITRDLAQPIIKIERFFPGFEIVNQSDKTVIIESHNGSIVSTGSGDLFLSDICSYVTINNPAERVWAWQFNAEGGDAAHPAALINNVKTMRIVGWKDEGSGTSALMQKGILEILGFMNYPNPYAGGTAGETEFVIQDGAQFSLACETQISFSGQEYTLLVQETRNGVTKTLTSSNSGTGYNLPLYTGYDSAKVADAAPVRRAGSEGGRALSPIVRVAGKTIIIDDPARNVNMPLSITIFALDGSLTPARIARGIDGGAYMISGLPHGVYALVLSKGTVLHRQVISI